MKIKFETFLVIICGILFLAGLVKAQTIGDSIKEVSAQIEKDSANADNYLKRANLYADLWNSDQSKLENIAFATADLSKYIKLNPDNADAYRQRAKARYLLFLGVNRFTIADLQKVVALDPKDEASKALLVKYQADYKKMYVSRECKEARSKFGFQGHPNDEPLTVLAMSLDTSIDEGNFDYQPALKNIACGADVNYVYQQGPRVPEFSGISAMHPINIIAMLEAGAKTEGQDKFGNTVLMMDLQSYISDKQSGLDDEYLSKYQLGEKMKILLFYGANANAKNLKGKSLMSLAEKTKNYEIIQLLKNAGAK